MWRWCINCIDKSNNLASNKGLVTNMLQKSNLFRQFDFSNGIITIGHILKRTIQSYREYSKEKLEKINRTQSSLCSLDSLKLFPWSCRGRLILLHSAVSFLQVQSCKPVPILSLFQWQIFRLVHYLASPVQTISRARACHVVSTE